MKTLYLVRHAKSSWKYPNLDDFERPLNKRGRKNAPFMGRILKKLKVAPDLVISSPANRAATTARIIADSIDYPLEKIHYNETIYASSEHELIQVIQQLGDAVNRAMLVSHNPALTDLANTIADTAISNIPTCGVVGLNLNISSWVKIGEQRGKLKFFEFPKKHTS
ncbi:MAG: histidine phosphatase family protein [Desulfobacterales bacterium]|jgi:phosphohistidine phosphatase|nr:histidine phosphatase family protein [Desulfobacterales bacterium]